MTTLAIKVFVSSTWLDLRSEREAVEETLHRFRETKYVGMEYFGSRSEAPTEGSLAELNHSSVYIGIVGGRYGSGITRTEYERAITIDLPCFIYFKAEAALIQEPRDPEAERQSKLAEFKTELSAAHLVNTFRTPHELSALIAADLHNWLTEQYLKPRLERAIRGEGRAEAQAILNQVRDVTLLPPSLRESLIGVGLVITAAALVFQKPRVNQARARRRVLFAGPHADNAHRAGVELSRAGWKVELLVDAGLYGIPKSPANRTDEVLQALEILRPDVLIIDLERRSVPRALEMETVTEVVRRIKIEPSAHRNLRIVFITEDRDLHADLLFIWGRERPEMKGVSFVSSVHVRGKGLPEVLETLESNRTASDAG